LHENQDSKKGVHLRKSATGAMWMTFQGKTQNKETPSMADATQLFGRVYRRGEVIFEESVPGDEMYIIQSAAVEISRNHGNRRVTLNLLEKGEFFGEMALVDSQPRSATATAVGRTRLLPVSKRIFLERTGGHRTRLAGPGTGHRCARSAPRYSHPQLPGEPGVC
jgi:CRP-like cAMP-binding protein